MVVASASLIALLVVLGVQARQGTVREQRSLATVLLGAAALIVLVGVVAFVWTLTRPS